MDYEWDELKAAANLEKHGVDLADDLGPKSNRRRAAPLRDRVMRKEYDFGQAKRGSVVPVPKGKTRITIRLDEDVVEWFKQQVHAAGGGNYQSLINAALRKYIEERREPLEETLRRVIREELKTA